MGLKSINEPDGPGRLTMVTPVSINEPPRLPDGEVPPVEGETPPNPSLNSINPNTAKEDAGSVSFNATGTRFYPGSKISFGGEFIDTLFVNTGKLTGTFDTADYGEGSYLVHIDNNEGGLSISKTFTVTSASAEADPDDLEEAIEEAEEDGEFVPTHRKRKR